jgi:thioredoxin reductase
MPDSEVFDVLIIGGGFAGLTAAATLARQLHTAAIFDSGIYRNARSDSLRVMPTWDGQDPESFRAAARAELEKYDSIRFVRTEIKGVVKGEKGMFEASDAAGQTWQGRKLILASGVCEIYPAIPGYEECWARGM